jgi:hypothetical protein
MERAGQRPHRDGKLLVSDTREAAVSAARSDWGAFGRQLDKPVKEALGTGDKPQEAELVNAGLPSLVLLVTVLVQ